MGFLFGSNGLFGQIGKIRNGIGGMQSDMGINTALNRPNKNDIWSLMQQGNAGGNSGLGPAPGTFGAAPGAGVDSMTRPGGMSQDNPFNMIAGALGMAQQGGWQNPVTGQTVGTQAPAPAQTQAMNYWRKTGMVKPFGDWFGY
jgi:hypothetical protein